MPEFSGMVLEVVICGTSKQHITRTVPQRDFSE